MGFGFLLLDGISSFSLRVNHPALFEPLDINILSSLDCALKHYGFPLFPPLDAGHFPDYRCNLNIEIEIGIDFSKFVVDSTLVETSILRSRILQKKTCNYQKANSRESIAK